MPSQGEKEQMKQLLSLFLLWSAIVAAQPGWQQELSAAQLALAQKNYEAARAGLEKLLPMAKEDAYAAAVIQQNLGYAWLGLNRPEAAQAAFIAALQSNALPAAARQDLRYNLAQLRSAAGQFGAAAEMLRDWLRDDPRNQPEAPLYLQLALLYRQSGQAGAALAALELARKQRLLDEAGLMLLAQWYAHDRLPARAVAVLQEWIGENPGAGGEAYLWLGIALARDHRRAEARKALTRALDFPASRASAEQWLQALGTE
jgi:tetratricopeptide (TPR) repeat protein